MRIAYLMLDIRPYTLNQTPESICQVCSDLPITLKMGDNIKFSYATLAQSKVLMFVDMSSFVAPDWFLELRQRVMTFGVYLVRTKYGPRFATHINHHSGLDTEGYGQKYELVVQDRYIRWGQPLKAV